MGYLLHGDTVTMAMIIANIFLEIYLFTRFPPVFFLPENVVYFLRLMHIFKCTNQTRYFHGRKQYEP